MSKQNFLISEGRVTPISGGRVSDRIEPAVYQMMNSMAGIFFEKISDFTRQKKYYGNVEEVSSMAIDAFKHRDKNTGIMLHGRKGTGKSATAHLIAIKAIEELGLPVIYINDVFSDGAAVASAVDNIGECVVFIDEFEKITDADDQAALLSMFDGMGGSKKLFVLTLNKMHKVDEHMINRPGRILFSVAYEGMDEGVLEEYVKDHMIHPHHHEDMMRVVGAFPFVTFDILSNLIDEINRTNRKPTEHVRYLNIDPGADNMVAYDVTVVMNGAVTTSNHLYLNGASDNPLMHKQINIEGQIFTGKTIMSDDEDPKPMEEQVWREMKFRPMDALVSATKGAVHFKVTTDENEVVDIHYKPVSSYNFIF